MSCKQKITFILLFLSALHYGVNRKHTGVILCIFTRNTMAQDRLNALCMISIEKRLIYSISNFHKQVIDIFALQKDRRINYVYK